MNLRRDSLIQLLLVLTFGFLPAVFAADEPEMDEVIDLTNVVKPKKEAAPGSKRESQEATIESQVDEYGEGGSGLKPAPKKTTVGEQLKTIEKESVGAQKATQPQEAPEVPESPNETVERSEDDGEGGESAVSEDTATDEEAGVAEAAQSAPEESVSPEAEPESVENVDSVEPVATEEPQRNLEPEPDPMSATSNVTPAHGHPAHECSCARKTQFEPYAERRQKWGTLFSLGTSFYNPINYEPDYAVGSFLDTYGSNNPEAFELSIGAKLNLGRAGSLAFLASGGTYRKAASNGASLSLNPVSVGANYYLDTLFREPYVVPYFGGGAYTLFFRESLASNAVGGRTGFGFYYSVGLAFQLDWMDEYGDLNQYSESEVENTFLYVEGRGITGVLYNEAVKQRDFSNSFFAAAGLRFEF